jgi:hypothetical protein
MNMEHFAYVSVLLVVDEAAAVLDAVVVGATGVDKPSLTSILGNLNWPGSGGW